VKNTQNETKNTAMKNKIAEEREVTKKEFTKIHRKYKIAQN